MRILLDTNVLAVGMVGVVRGSLNSSTMIWRLWRAKQFDLLLSDHILSELTGALDTSWFRARLSVEERRDMEEELGMQAVPVEATAITSGVTSHWQDDLVLSSAISGNADYLVTRDAAFRRVGEYQGVKIRTPDEFLQEFDARTA